MLQASLIVAIDGGVTAVRKLSNITADVYDNNYMIYIAQVRLVPPSVCMQPLRLFPVSLPVQVDLTVRCDEGTPPAAGGSHCIVIHVCQFALN